MIRRLHHDVIVESIAPKPVRGGVVPGSVVLQHSTTDAEELDVRAYKQGYAEGFQSGEQDGRREAEEFHRAWEQETRQCLEEELQSVISEREHLSALVAGLHAELRAKFSEMEGLAFDLALTGLSRAFGSMQEDGELIRRLCLQLTQEHRTRAVRLEVATADRSALPDHIDGLAITVEHALSPGACRVVMERGYAESATGTRIDAIYDALREAEAMDRR